MRLLKFLSTLFKDLNEAIPGERNPVIRVLSPTK